MQDTDDIDALIDELHASTGAAAARPGSSLGIEALLATVVERRGSTCIRRSRSRASRDR